MQHVGWCSEMFLTPVAWKIIGKQTVEYMVNTSLLVADCQGHRPTQPFHISVLMVGSAESVHLSYVQDKAKVSFQLYVISLGWCLACKTGTFLSVNCLLGVGSKVILSQTSYTVDKGVKMDQLYEKRTWKRRGLFFDSSSKEQKLLSGLISFFQ